MAQRGPASYPDSAPARPARREAPVYTIDDAIPSYRATFGLAGPGGELRALRGTFGFSDEVMARFARNSVTASFLPEGRKRGLLSEIDAWIATRPS